MKRFFSKTNIALFALLSLVIALMILDSKNLAAGRPAGDYPALNVETVEAFGKEIPYDALTVELTGDEIDGVDGLIETLSKFPSLRFVDLGSYPVTMEEAKRITGALVDLDLKCRIAVPMYGKTFLLDAREIDLGDADISDTDELYGTLCRFPNVRRVSAEREIPVAKKRELQDEYGYVRFDIPSSCEVCGIRFDDGATDIDLRGAGIDSGIIGQLGSLSSLESVDLHGAEISNDLKKELIADFPSVRFLWEVDILGEKYESTVTDLDLSGKRGLTTDDVREIIPLFCDLRRIDLSDCGMSNEELAALRAEFPGTKIVWRLTMGKWSLKTDAVAFSVLIYNYNYTRLRNEDIEVLKYCTDLQALDLGHQAITDISVIGEYLQDLRILILADNCLHDIEPVRKLKHLHYIELFVNPYLNDVTPLEDCKELVDVNVSHLYTIHDISGLLDFPILERLWIEHTATSQADIELLRRTYPDARVVDQGYGSVDQGWRTHPRYFAMIDMYFETNYMNEEFSKYDGLVSYDQYEKDEADN